MNINVPQFRNNCNNSNNNKLIDGYKNMNNNNVPFKNNVMLSNNPTFYGSIRDTNFHNRINMEKMERLKKIKNIDDLGLSKDKLTDFIICPIKVEKEDKNRLHGDYEKKGLTYVNFNKKGNQKSYEKDGIVYIDFEDELTDFIKNLHCGRSNNPYKNILKKENYNKEFKNKKDLLVHKVTLKDKDQILLAKEYEELADLLEMHDGELKIKYSASKETKHKEKFDYVNMYKHKVLYDPHNFGELKSYYKKEQQKINKTNKRLDQMMEILLASDLSPEELSEIQKPLMSNDDNNQKLSIVVQHKNDKLDREIEEEMEIELKKELEKEYGNDVLEKMVKDYVNDNKKNKESKHISIENSNGNNEEKPKKRITIKSKKEKTVNTETEIGKINDDEMEKYKRKMKK